MANIFLILYEICEYLYIKSKFALIAVEWKTRMMPTSLFEAYNEGSCKQSTKPLVIVSFGP